MNAPTNQTQRSAGGVTFLLTRKAVKNINLRLRPDGTVAVSASPRVPLSRIDQFVASHAPQILTAQESLRQKALPTLTPAQRKELVTAFFPMATALTAEILPQFQAFSLPMPEVKVRYMTSRWGSCYTTRNTIVLNARLLDYPPQCAAFVVTHELCHFVHPNHSPQFYALLTQMMPQWQMAKALLR